MEDNDLQFAEKMLEEFKRLASAEKYQTMISRLETMHERAVQDSAMHAERKRKVSVFAKENGWRLLDISQLVQPREAMIQISKDMIAGSHQTQELESDLENIKNQLKNLSKPTLEEIITWNTRFPESSLPTDPDQLVKVLEEPGQGSS